MLIINNLARAAQFFCKSSRKFNKTYFCGWLHVKSENICRWVVITTYHAWGVLFSGDAWWYPLCPRVILINKVSSSRMVEKEYYILILAVKRNDEPAWQHTIDLSCVPCFRDVHLGQELGPHPRSVSQPVVFPHSDPAFVGKFVWIWWALIADEHTQVPHARSQALWGNLADVAPSKLKLK